MNMMGEFLAEIDWHHWTMICLRVLVVLVVAWVVEKVGRGAIRRMEVRLKKKYDREGDPPSESSKRIETLTKLLNQTFRICLWFVVALIILRQVGVSIGPILASVGVAGLAVGFGAQNLVRDVISGFFMIIENQVRVGDVAIVNGTGGLVEQVNLRTIVLRDLAGVVHVFPNGVVDTLSNMTRDWSAHVFDIGVAYKENTDQVVEIIKRVAAELQQDDYYGKLILEEPEVFGVDKFDDSAVVIKGRIKTKPIRQWETGREFMRRIKLAFDEQDIEIPFPHSTLYFGEASKPFDLRILEKAGVGPVSKA